MRQALKSGRANDFMAVPRPVIALARDLQPQYEIDWHSHPRFQLVYATRGVMAVDTRDATWVVPPQRAVWMPPAVEHRLTARGVVQLRSLYIRPEAAAHGFAIGRLPVRDIVPSQTCHRARISTRCTQHLRHRLFEIRQLLDRGDLGMRVEQGIEQRRAGTRETDQKCGRELGLKRRVARLR